MSLNILRLSFCKFKKLLYSIHKIRHINYFFKKMHFTNILKIYVVNLVINKLINKMIKLKEIFLFKQKLMKIKIQLNLLFKMMIK